MEGDELRTVFGRNVKLYRNRRNWSQADLAEYADVSINFLGDIERGKKWPHPDTLVKIAHALEINVFELFMEENINIAPETLVLMNRFIKDVSLILNKNIFLSVNQSVEYVQKQYGLEKRTI